MNETTLLPLAEHYAKTGDVVGGGRPCADNGGELHALTAYDEDRADALFARGRALWQADPTQGPPKLRVAPRDYHMMTGGRASFSFVFPQVLLVCDPSVPE